MTIALSRFIREAHLRIIWVDHFLAGLATIIEEANVVHSLKLQTFGQGNN
jgi:hypothetical protein